MRRTPKYQATPLFVILCKFPSHFSLCSLQIHVCFFINAECSAQCTHGACARCGCTLHLWYSKRLSLSVQTKRRMTTKYVRSLDYYYYRLLFRWNNLLIFWSRWLQLTEGYRCESLILMKLGKTTKPIFIFVWGNQTNAYWIGMMC